MLNPASFGGEEVEDAQREGKVPHVPRQVQILCPDAGSLGGPWTALTLHGDPHTVPMEAEAALPRPGRAASPLRGTVRSRSGHLKT